MQITYLLIYPINKRFSIMQMKNKKENKHEQRIRIIYESDLFT